MIIHNDEELEQISKELDKIFIVPLHPCDEKIDIRRKELINAILNYEWECCNIKKPSLKSAVLFRYEHGGFWSAVWNAIKLIYRSIR